MRFGQIVHTRTAKLPAVPTCGVCWLPQWIQCVVELAWHPPIQVGSPATWPEPLWGTEISNVSLYVV